MDGPASGNFGHIDLRNNILVNTATGYAIDVSSTAVTGNYLRTSDYNDLYTKGTTLGYYGSTSVTNLSNWRTTTSKDLHSISVDALFKSATDLHLTNYTSFVLATPLNEVPYDIDGALRSIKPTIGADERPVIANDAGITGFVSTKLIGCDGSLPIVVKLTNFGTNKLSSVKINTKINGLSMSAYTFSGSLGYLHDTTVLIGYATFTYGTNYKIVATTQSPNGIPDQYADNNSDSMQILKLYPFPVIKSVTNDSVCKGTKASLSVSSDNSSSFYWYDSLIGGTLLAEAHSFITGTLQSSRTYYVEAATKGDPDSLMTSNQSGPSEMGNMFDVQALNTDIIIDSFSVQPAVLSGISLPMAIYYKKGSYVGYEYRDNAWTLLGVDTII